MDGPLIILLCLCMRGSGNARILPPYGVFTNFELLPLMKTNVALMVYR